MSSSSRDPNFPSTRWSLVERARGDDAFLRREALGTLVKRYWPALQAHLVIRRRLAPDAADELLQGFAADRILEQQFLGHADPAKGRFRSFLLRCLENYRIDRLRAQRPSQRLDDEHEANLADPSPAHDVFEVAWARLVLETALRRTWLECREQGKREVWQLFDRRVLQPAVSHASPTSYDELVGELGLESAQQAANLLVTAKRHFRRVLQSVVAEYVSSEAEIDDEISDLRSILAAGPIVPSPLEGNEPSLIERIAADIDVPNLLGDSDVTRVANLFHVDTGQESAWEPLDLERLLTRLLLLPMTEALPGLSPHDSGTVTTQSPTLAALFTGPNPPLDLLKAIKEWSRRSTHAPDPPLPSDIASLFYFAAITAAHLRHKQWISKLDLSLLRQGIEMLLAKPWIDEPFRGLFDEFISKSHAV
jgi:RNA polymerase sigma-70 factor (ECF subfamily)